jgi:two-component system response regulator AtoC
VVVIVSEARASTASGVIALGATECLVRPLGSEQIRRALDRAQAASEDAEPSLRSGESVAASLLGTSKPIDNVRDILRRVSPGSSTVLIRGESGTGKELVARAVHELSPRRAAPFVKVHCASLPDTLLESELFGYERGAFTGALSRKPGRVELADGGTLFLDEIGDIAPQMQVKLLRLLQDREYERLGGTSVMAADVRFIAATHRDLDAMVKSGEFREDLFYRLNVVTIWVPPLRARRDDIPLLAERFCSVACRLNDKHVSFSEEALSALRAMRWPGNVRQLQNLVEKLVVLSDDTEIGADQVQAELLQDRPPFSTQTSGIAADEPPESVIATLGEELRQTERRALERALQRAKGNRSLAARVLGVSRATLYKKLADHGLE